MKCQILFPGKNKKKKKKYHNLLSAEEAQRIKRLKNKHYWPEWLKKRK